MEIGQSVEVYTVILRGMSQNSYPGQIVAVSEHGLTVKTTSGIILFPWGAIERIMLK